MGRRKRDPDLKSDLRQFVVLVLLATTGPVWVGPLLWALGKGGEALGRHLVRSVPMYSQYAPPRSESFTQPSRISTWKH
jgi:hypothetical protein